MTNHTNILMCAATNTVTRSVSRIAPLLRVEQGADEAGLSGADRAIRCGERALLQRRKRGNGVPPPSEEAVPGVPTTRREKIRRSAVR